MMDIKSSDVLGEPKLDAPSLAIVERLEANPFLDPVSMSPTEMRVAFDTYYATVDMAPSPAQVQDVIFQSRNGPTSARLYRPEGAAPGPLPVALFFRGGGLVMGSLRSYDTIARRLCASSGSLVVAVDYRQPPEHKYPAALDDCHDSLRWIRASAEEYGGDSRRVAVAGDSGGGMLAVVVTHRVRDAAEPALAAQVLIYPAVGARERTRSMDEFASGYVFSPDQLDWLYAQYLDDPADRWTAAVSPALREDLSGLPPAYVVTAHFDIFRDEGECYASRLRDFGVPAEVVRYRNVIHGFINMGGPVTTAGVALDGCGRFLAGALSTPEPT
jgi:acetyl esterase